MKGKETTYKTTKFTLDAFDMVREVQKREGWDFNMTVSELIMLGFESYTEKYLGKKIAPTLDEIKNEDNAIRALKSGKLAP